MLISHKRIDRSPEADILESAFYCDRVNVHVIFREGYFVDCPSVSFGFAIANREEHV